MNGGDTYYLKLPSGAPVETSLSDAHSSPRSLRARPFGHEHLRSRRRPGPHGVASVQQRSQPPGGRIKRKRDALCLQDCRASFNGWVTSRLSTPKHGGELNNVVSDPQRVNRATDAVFNRPRRRERNRERERTRVLEKRGQQLQRLYRPIEAGLDRANRSVRAAYAAVVKRHHGSKVCSTSSTKLLLTPHLELALTRAW